MFLGLFGVIKGLFTTATGGINYTAIIVVVLGIGAVTAGVVFKLELDKTTQEIATGAKDAVKLKQAIQDNKDLAVQEKNTQITEQNAETAITTVVATDATNKKKVETITEATNKAVSKVVIPLTVPSKNEDEVSLLRINAVWQTYCTLNPQNCK